MRLKEKINLKKYISLSLALLLASYGLCRNLQEFMASSIVFSAVILNQWMLLGAVDGVIQNALNKDAAEKTNIVVSFLMKAIILVVALTFGVHIMGNRIIIPIIIYVAQIFVLYFSLVENKKD